MGGWQHGRRCFTAESWREKRTHRQHQALGRGNEVVAGLGPGLNVLNGCFSTDGLEEIEMLRKTSETESDGRHCNPCAM